MNENTIDATLAYDALAGDYDNLISDCDAFAESIYETLLQLLPQLHSASRILDCACGTGIECLSLARHGYSVHGSDASPGMLKQARKRFQSHGLKIPTTQCTWEELPHRFKAGSFDIVLCLGNSISHCLSQSSLLASLRGMSAVTAVEGTLVIQLRDWDRLLAEKPRFTIGSAHRQGQRQLIPIYLWDLQKLWQPSNLEVIFLELEGDLVRPRSYTLPFCPIPSDALLKSIRDAGFTDVNRHELEDSGWYTLRATKE